MEESASSCPIEVENREIPIDSMNHEIPNTPSSINPETPSSPVAPNPKKSRKSPTNKSWVWNHLTKLESFDTPDSKCRCNFCSKTMECYHANGISHLSNHLTRYCPKSTLRHSKLEKNQTLLQFGVKRDVDGKVTTPVGYVKYDPDRLRISTAKYFVRSELPFRNVEHEGFVEYVADLEPRFILPSRNTLRNDCLKLYGDEKRILKDFMRGQRVCITTDTWTSLQKINYMCTTAHFIDGEWNLHKKIINFCHVSNHLGDTVGRMLEQQMLDWGIDRLLTITVDNASTNDGAVEYMRRRIRDKECTVLQGEFLHMRCAAHILNLIVTKGLEDVKGQVERVKEAVKWVNNSHARVKKFKECVKREKIYCGKSLYIDCPTRWNSTYLMLSVAEKYERAFQLLADDEAGFRKYAPTNDDWEIVRVFVKFLKIFYDVTLTISGSLYVTPNTYFQQISIIEDTLNQYCQSSDPIMKNMAENMKSKFDKYWGSVERMNLIIYVAFVLDPRYKIKALVSWLVRCKGELKANSIETMVRDLLNRLVDQYRMFNGEHEFTSSETSSSGNMNERRRNSTPFPLHSGVDDEKTSIVKIFNQHLGKDNQVECVSELERYLLHGPEDLTEKFDILAWWKLNTSKYPIIAQIARDVLAIPISTVSSESAFSIGGRVMDPFRCSLNEESVEALICTQSWLMRKPIDIRVLGEYVESIDLSDDTPSNSTT